MKNSTGKFFLIRDAYYQSWIVNENEKGTNIVIELTGVQPGILFDSIVYRGIRLSVAVQDKDGIVYLKSKQNVGSSKLSTENGTAPGPDRILFRYNGTNQSYILKEIRRLNTKYY